MSGNTDLGSNLSSVFSTASLSRDSAQLFEPETVGKKQGEGTVRSTHSWKLQLPEKVKVCFWGEEGETEL